MFRGDRSDAVRSGAAAGASAWAAYAIVETLFLSLVARLVFPAYAYEPQNWAFTLVMFVVSAAAGALAGAVCGLLFRGPVAGRAAGATLIVAFGVNLLRQFGHGHGLSVSAAAAAALLIAILLQGRFPRLTAPTHPWTVAMLLVGSAWVGKDAPLHTQWSKLGGALVYVAGVLLLTIAVARLLRSPAQRRLAAAGFAAAVLVLARFPDQAPILHSRTGAIPTPAPDAPNVLLITMDTVRADHLSLYGYARDTTPQLRRFASEATLYKRALSASDMTLASHASIFTSLWPSEHGAHVLPNAEAGDGLADKFRTLAEILRDSGYSTAAVVANKAILSHDYGLDQGFDHFERLLPVPFLGDYRHHYLRRVLRNVLARFAEAWQSERLLALGENINRHAFRVLDDLAARRRPWLLFLNYMDAHHPYAPPLPFAALFREGGPDDLISRYLGLADMVNAGRARLTDRERRYAISQYDAGIAYEDFCLGRLFDHLKQRGIYDRTLIIVTSDHGEAFGEKGLMAHGISVYENQIRVPLLIRYPGVTAPRIVEEPVSAVDLLPTVLDVAGLPAPTGLRGVSLRSGPRPANRILVAESYPSQAIYHLNPRFHRILRAVFSASAKLVAATDGKRELYDIAHDPHEENNLYGKALPEQTALTTGLADWIRRTPAAESSATHLETAGVEGLRSLGYLQ